jgi:ribonucleoside-diphosphate reductase beta chain
MSIFDTRDIYKPFEYPVFEEIHTKLMSAFWHPHEVSLDEDKKDFRQKITKDEREIVTRILRNFVQSEIHVGCFWGESVADWFKKPEIQNVARFISGNETIHAFGYDYLNAELGLEEYHLLKDDKKLYARVENLINKKAKTKENIIKQIALYSVFGEGVALFSSFLILFAFTKKNLFKNIGQIISWSSIDENLHAEVGCMLFNQIKKEFPELLNEELQAEIKAIADKIVSTEMDLIDRVFENVFTEAIKPEHVKNFINDRANKQLKKIGFKKRFKVNEDMLKETEFFEIYVNGESVVDFFANKETNYSKGSIIFDDKVWK